MVSVVLLAASWALFGYSLGWSLGVTYTTARCLGYAAFTFPWFTVAFFVGMVAFTAWVAASLRWEV